MENYHEPRLFPISDAPPDTDRLCRKYNMFSSDFSNFQTSYDSYNHISYVVVDYEDPLNLRIIPWLTKKEIDEFLQDPTKKFRQRWVYVDNGLDWTVNVYNNLSELEIQTMDQDLNLSQ